MKERDDIYLLDLKYYPADNYGQNNFELAADSRGVENGGGCGVRFLDHKSSFPPNSASDSSFEGGFCGTRFLGTSAGISNLYSPKKYLLEEKLRHK